VIGGIQSPPSAWYAAIVQGSIYLAAVKSAGESLAFQQLAVSHAAHNSLAWVFHGTRNYGAVDAALRAVLKPIGLDSTSRDAVEARSRGIAAANEVVTARSDDKIGNFVDYIYGPENPGIYQQSPGANTYPDTPQARYVRPFAGLGNVTRFRAPPPPKTSDSDYESYLLYVKAQGDLNSTVRKAFDTDTAYFWRESSIM